MSETIKVGDTVRCIPIEQIDWSKTLRNLPGQGYKANYTFIVHNKIKDCTWEEGKNLGVYTFALEKVITLQKIITIVDELIETKI